MPSSGFDKVLVDWMRPRLTEPGFRLFREELEKLEGAALVAAIPKGDTDFEKGLLRGYRRVNQLIEEIIKAGD